MFNPVAPYGYLLPNMYLFIADIANPDSVCCCRTWICLDITCFHEEKCQLSSGSACLACQKTVNWEVSTQFTQQFVSDVTAPPHVGCHLEPPH